MAIRFVTTAIRFVTTAIRFNPFPLRDFPYLTSFAGAEKVTPLHTYLPHRGTSRERRDSTNNRNAIGAIWLQ
ncbi:MAG: hypothetical protein J6J06_05920 [Bacteroidaceae bacterium]|nr:hypothetical protein [Bacteroidaceae bacterium]